MIISLKNSLFFVSIYKKKFWNKNSFDKKIIIYQMTMSISLYMVFSIIFKYNNNTTTIILFLKNTLKNNSWIIFKKIIMFSNIMIKIIMFLYIFTMYLHVSSKKISIYLHSLYVVILYFCWKNLLENCAKNFMWVLYCLKIFQLWWIHRFWIFFYFYFCVDNFSDFFFSSFFCVFLFSLSFFLFFLYISIIWFWFNIFYSFGCQFQWYFVMCEVKKNNNVIEKKNILFCSIVSFYYLYLCMYLYYMTKKGLFNHWSESTMFIISGFFHFLKTKLLAIGVFVCCVVYVFLFLSIYICIYSNDQ